MSCHVSDGISVAPPQYLAFDFMPSSYRSYPSLVDFPFEGFFSFRRPTSLPASSPRHSTMTASLNHRHHHHTTSPPPPSYLWSPKREPHGGAVGAISAISRAHGG